MKKVFNYMLLFLFFLIFIYALVSIVIWQKDNSETKEDYKKIMEEVKITENSDNINSSLLDVDFGKLKEENSDLKGWIKVLGTDINYPFVQGKDNDYYLKHSFSKKNNSAGWVFLDYKNNNIFNDKNTIIYAHSRKDGSMFGTLKNVLTKKWIADKSNHIIQITNEKNSYQAVVFSVYKIKTSNDYLQINYIDNQFIEKALKRSIYNFSQDINKNDKILTLTTCASSKEKIVLHAKLID